MSNIVYCRIVSWADRVPRAEHYYVTLLNGGFSDRVEKTVWNVLTLSEVERYNRKSPGERWVVGKKVGSFFSRGRAIRGAVGYYQEAFPGAVVLVEGDTGTYDPQLILDGPPGVMEKLNSLFVDADDIGWWEDDEEAMQIISDEWRAIWESEFEVE